MKNAMNFTQEQARAITLRGKNILVSASAGSGKTTVMTERVLSLLAEGHNLSQMLIVTFTRAAAADMKEKLAQKLSKSDNKIVRNQLELLPLCDISTLHSFCQKLIGSYFYTVGLDPEFRLIEDFAPLLDKSIDAAIAEFSEGDNEDFFKLSDIFSSAQSDFQLKKLIQSSMISAENSGENTAINSRELVENLLDNRRQNLIEKAEQLRIDCHAAGFKRNLNQLESFRENLMAKQPPNTVRGKIEPQFSALNDDYKTLKSMATALLDDYARLDNSKEQSSQYLAVLNALSERACQLFAAEKKENVLDFNDLEAYALKILNSEAGAQIRDKYKYIFCDEYQDINPLQNQIIDALRGDNFIFLVGDIKQSIYAFRGCEPDIFLKKQEEFEKNPDCEVIKLNANHRSTDAVLSFCNDLFCRTFTKDFGGTDYQTDSRFILSGKAGGRVSLHSVKTEKNEEQEDGVYDITAHRVYRDLTAESVYTKIIEILENEVVSEGGVSRPALFRDIAVLTRSMGETAQNIASLLQKQNIPSVFYPPPTEDEGAISGLIAYLRMIDNPLNDEALIGAAKSYFGGFSDDELAQIRLDFPDTEYFFEAFFLAAQKPSKAAEFLAKIDHYRQLNLFNISSLIGKIVADFDYFQYLFYKGGAQKLEVFLETAEANESMDLGEFLAAPLSIAIKEDAPDAVIIMTVHASKGLEFPFVIIIDAHKRFNMRDLYAPALIFKGKAAIKHYDYEGEFCCDSPDWLFNYYSLFRRRHEEELRLLYVACTRAKISLDIFFDGDFKEKPRFFEAQDAISWLCWLRLLAPVYSAKEVSIEPLSFNQVQRVPPKPNPQLTATLIERFASEDSEKTTEKYAAKSYVTALIKEDETDEIIEPLFSDDSALKRGIIYHKIMEGYDFICDPQLYFDSLDIEERAQVNRQQILDCIDAVRELIGGDKFFKEQGFIFNDGGTLIQGVIDLIILKEEGAIILDYKTGAIDSHYKKQLDYYARATESILKIPVTKKYIYSFKERALILL